MARTSSNMIPLGQKAPDFTLPDVVSGKEINFYESKSDKANVVMFICNHCPFVKLVLDKIVDIGSQYTKEGVAIFAISANDVENYPQDSPEKMKELALEKGFDFPYLYDESQDTAKTFDAACTPDFYVYDGEMNLMYRGQMDDARPDNGVEVSGKDLRIAIDHILQGIPVPDGQVPSVGCNIKWK